MRSAIASSVLTAALLLGIAAPAAPQEAAQHLVPDLRPLRPSNVQVSDGPGGSKQLRFTTDVLNRGDGPLELRPVEADCDGNGDLDDDRLAYQELFVDDGDGTFERGVDLPDVEGHPAGCQHFHIEHRHWHFDDFGLYKLMRYRADGSLVRAAVSKADKVSFCMVDSYPLLDLPGAPAQAFYKAAEGIDCGQDNTTGISVGWVDSYGWTVAGQSLPLDGLPNGPYCLRVRTDPQRLLVESDDTNNVRSVKLKLRGWNVEVVPDAPCVVRD